MNRLIPTRFWSLAAAFAVVLALFGPAVQGPAWAQSGEATVQSIRTQMEKGQALFLAGDVAGAAQVFDQGYAQHPYAAFLFNAALCYQKLGQSQEALDRYKRYLEADAAAPDAPQVRERIAALEAALGVGTVPSASGSASADPSASAAPSSSAPPVGSEAPPVLPPPPIVPVDDDELKSLVVLETDPPGAPVHVYRRLRADAPTFRRGAANPDYARVIETTAPANLTLAIGSYHLVVEEYRDFNASEADVEVAAGRVLHFKANLSQGEFMGFLRVSGNVREAAVYVDREPGTGPEWGHTPHGELVGAGKHRVVVTAPGYVPFDAEVAVSQGEQKELQVELARVDWGILRITADAPDAEVYVDGLLVGTTSAGAAPVETKQSSGAHRVTVRAKKYKTFEGLIDVPHGQVLPVAAQMVPKQPRGGAWAQAIIGAAVLGGAIYAGVESDRLYTEAEEARAAGRLDSSDASLETGKWLAVGADAGFGVAGIFGALAIYGFIRDPLPESSRELRELEEFGPSVGDGPARPPPAEPAARGPRLSPMASPAGGGIMIGGTF